MNLLVISLIEFIFYFFKIRKKKVLFCSFFGQYNDNPKYISEKLHDLAPDLDLIWVHSSKGRDLLPEYVKHVEFQSVKYYYYLYTAQVVVDNHTGLRTGFCNKKRKLLNLYFKFRSKKKKGQFCISTWHGTPLKKICLDEPGGDSLKSYYNCDLLLSGCSYTTKCLMSANRNLIRISEIGTPRNDILLNTNININNIKKKLGLPTDKKIVLFAPTFRKDVNLSGVRQITEDFNYPKLLSSLSKTFGGEWCFAYRVHNLVLHKIDAYKIEQETDIPLINANQHDDMAEYLKCIDVLITDYSGSLYDIALTEKPCFLYVPDYENYKYSERGFYMDFEKLPFPSSTTFDEMIQEVNEFNSYNYNKKRNFFLETIGNKEDGQAAKKVADIILSFINGE